MIPTWHEERRLLQEGYHLIAGIDEVGRGPLAGPVFAAAVILDPEADAPCYADLRDSKTLTALQRERIARAITDVAVSIGIGAAEHWEIDALGIVKATRTAMARAVAKLSPPPQFLIIDAIPLPEPQLPFRAIIKADARCCSVAAASIVAKVARDQRMVQEDSAHPGYGFARHKGYGTREHLERLRHLGPSPIHRRSFSPVKALIEPVATTTPPLRQTRGRIGERVAAAYLQERGYRLLDRNFRSPWGEIDLVAQDHETLVFIEVRARRNDRMGSPLESITRAKQRKLVLTAQEYLQRHGLEEQPWRIDVVGIRLGPGNLVESVECLQNAVVGF